MGLLDGILGNASELSTDTAMKDYERLLAPGERIEKAYKLIRDMFIFTDKRLILVDIQGVTGKKVEYLSVPYRKISQFSIETTGHFDLDAELKIWVSGMGNAPIGKKFSSKINIYELQSVLAAYVLR